MKRTCCIAVILGLMIIAGCQEAQDASEAEPARTSITSENFKTIAGMQWILQGMTVDGEAIELTGEKPFIRFDDDKISGFASVNRFFGKVQIDDKGHVQWGPFGSTMMAGSEAAMKQEHTFLKALSKTERLSTAKIYLYVSSEDGKTELLFYVPVE